MRKTLNLAELREREKERERERQRETERDREREKTYKMMTKVIIYVNSQI